MDLLDIRMPVSDGTAKLRRLREAGLLNEGTVRVLVLTTFDLDEYLDQAIRLGVSGFLLKTARFEDLISAVSAAAKGDVPLAPSVVRRLVDHYRGRASPDTEALKRLAVLTERERQVLATLAAGRSNAEIAACLHLPMAIPVKIV